SAGISKAGGWATANSRIAVVAGDQGTRRVVRSFRIKKGRNRHLRGCRVKVVLSNAAVKAEERCQSIGENLTCNGSHGGHNRSGGIGHTIAELGIPSSCVARVSDQDAADVGFGQKWVGRAQKSCNSGDVRRRHRGPSAKTVTRAIPAFT